MNMLSIELDSFACAATLVMDGAEPSTRFVSSTALLTTDGWLFTTPEKWPELEEQNATFFDARVVRFREGMDGGRPLGRESDDAAGPSFHCIDYLASLFRACAEEAGVNIARDTPALVVSVPSYAVAAYVRNSEAVRIPLPESTTEDMKAAVKKLYWVGISEAEMVADIERAGLRAGFASVLVQPAAIALGNAWLREIEGLLERLGDRTLTDYPRICAVEIADYGLGFVPLELSGGALVLCGQPLFLEHDVAEELQKSVKGAIQDVTDVQKAMIWQRFIAAPLRNEEWSMESGGLRLLFRSPDLQPDWTAAISSLRRFIAPDLLGANWFVDLLAGRGRFVSFFMSGYGLSHPGLNKMFEILMSGKKDNPPNFNRLGVLDHSVTGPGARPLLVGTRSASVNCDCIPRYILSVARHEQVKVAPKNGAGVYQSITIIPSSDPRDTAAIGGTVELPERKRPSLSRYVAMAEGAASVIFRVAILEHGKNDDQAHHYELTFDLPPWDVSRRLEVEVQVDDTDTIKIATTVGGVSTPVKIEKVIGEERSAAGWECIGLGRYEAFTDDYHRLLTQKMARQDGNAVVNYQRY